LTTQIHKKLIDYKTTFGIKKGQRICNAPFTGLYFTPGGHIKACCGQDNQYAFGIYPDTSIAGALKSPKRKHLQKSIKKDDFSVGCQACYHNIADGNFEAAMSTQYLPYSPSRKPQVLEFELSHYCNLNCIMCKLHTGNKNDNVYDEKFIQSLHPYLKNATASRFYGGEPFLIPMYNEIWNKIKQLNPGMQVHIQSNGTVLNNYIEGLLNEMNVFLGISIDAMHKPLYEKIRKGASFDVLMRNLQSFESITKSQNKAINYSYCPMTINWQDIPEFMNFVNKNRGILFFNTVNTPKKLSLKRLSSETLKIIIRTLSRERIHPNANPHAERNYQKLNHLINSLHSFMEINATAERKYNYLPFHELPKVYPDIITQEIYTILQGKLSEKQLQKPISPVIQNDFNELDAVSLKKETETILKTNDLTNFIDFFELNEHNLV